MIEMAEVVAQRYSIDRERQDAYALLGPQRTAVAQLAGRFDAEIVPFAARKQAQRIPFDRRAMALRRLSP